MPTWSDHEYLAGHNRFWKDMVVVYCTDKAESKDKALEAIAEQQKIVREKTLGEH